MIDFMRRMSQKAILFGSQVRTCFSSRHYPIITLERGIEVVLENQTGHAEDIKEYIEAKLKLGPSQAAKDFGSEVQQKAAGVFMWVVLVVHILNDAHVGGQGRIQELRKRLDVLPRDLHDLFRNILDRNNTNLEHLALCLQWILFARRPLTPPELYFALHCDGNTLGGLQSAAWDREDIPLDMIERFVITSSKGLAEIRRSRRPTVQFIHESVREFLLKSHDMINIYNSVPDEVGGRSQERLEKCCANYIDHVFNSIEMTNFLAKDLPVAHTTTESRLLRETCERIFPFLRYAVQNVFHHAEKAQQAGLPQNKFLEEFQFQHWLGVLNILLGRQTRRYKQSGLDCLLAEGNRPALLELVWRHTHAPRHACFVSSGAHYDYGSPLMVAVARDSRDVLRKVLDMQASYCGFEDLIPDLQRECDNAPSPLVPKGRDFDFQPHIRKAAGNALLATSDLFAASSTLLQILAAISWHYQDFSSNVDNVIRHLLSDRNLLALKILSRSPKLRSKSGKVFRAGTPHLVEACVSNHKKKVAMLLEVDVQLAVCKDDSGICTLTHACRAGYPEVIAIVLEASRSARQDAIQGGVDAPDHVKDHQACEELAELLVKHSDHDFSTSNMSALAYYATKGSDIMVEALLRSGAGADAVPWQGTNLLTCGIEGGHTGIVRMLLNAGASANASSRFCQAPLALAASLGHDTIVADLLSAGAEVNHESIDGRTALSHAAENGHHAIAMQLSQRGADLRHESAYGRNALSYAAENGRETIVDLLLVQHVHEAISGADATAQHSDCSQIVPSRQCASTELKSLLTPLHYAAGACHSGIVDRLLKRGADVESRNAWSQTPLVFTAAAGYANFDVLSLAIGSTLMSSPQDTAPSSPADSIGFAHASAPEMDSGPVPGEDALTLETEAIRSRRLDTVELLLLHGALIDSADDDGHTAVAWAAARGDTDMLKLLIERGASADVTDTLGRTPLMHAIRFGHAKAVALLLHTGEAAADSKTLVLGAGREEAEDRD
ncbi:26S proteasome regulatory subunit rpn-8 [Verticillium dahliae VDG2]|nr:26S proteasome regulatory subunit rpn-8 [Verticillium dahliae VDG2]